ncbi:hypothetical protein HUS84_32350, partial [Pseudomonas chlororaphis]|uniref:type III secretion system domain-containing protein n=1 Tax=Pseudomonas chlororaphis TaxID=587753 RepID=UPI001B32823E
LEQLRDGGIKASRLFEGSKERATFVQQLTRLLERNHITPAGVLMPEHSRASLRDIKGNNLNKVLWDPACRPSIDRLILRHRGITWTSLPACLDARQHAMLALEPRLPQLVIALGVVALNCPDHLLLKDHRQALEPYLDERHCEQLLALHRGWSPTEPALPAETLSQAALHAGTRWWLRDVEPAPLSDLLSLRLPPVADALLSVRENAIHWLIKLGRFL